MIVNRFDQHPDDGFEWPLTVVSEYTMFSDDDSAQAEWETLVSLRQDYVHKMLRGIVGKNALDEQMRHLKRHVKSISPEEIVSRL